MQHEADPFHVQWSRRNHRMTLRQAAHSLQTGDICGRANGNFGGEGQNDGLEKLGQQRDSPRAKAKLFWRDPRRFCRDAVTQDRTNEAPVAMFEYVLQHIAPSQAVGIVT